MTAYSLRHNLFKTISKNKPFFFLINALKNVINQIIEMLSGSPLLHTLNMIWTYKSQQLLFALLDSVIIHLLEQLMWVYI